MAREIAFSIFDYEELCSLTTSRYKASKNGNPLVLQITPVQAQNIWDSSTKLCPGVAEQEVDFANISVNEIYIENTGDQIICRSRNCQQVFSDTAVRECGNCQELFKTVMDASTTEPEPDLEQGELKAEIYDNDFIIQEKKDECFEEKNGEIKDEDNVGTVISFKKIKKEKIFKCEFCSLEFKNWEQRKKHINTIHADEMIDEKTECQKCGKELKNKMWLIRHQKHNCEQNSKRKVECPFCDKQFTVKGGRIVNHIHYYHADMQDTEDYKKILQQSKCPMCELCGLTFRSKELLSSHLRIDHAEEELNNTLLEICDVCGSRFKNKASLELHKQKKHPSGEREYLCGDCGKSWGSKAQLSQHVYTKHRKQENKCDVCGVKFSFIHALKRHIQTVHLKFKDFECKECSKKFASRQRLTKHRLEIHEKLKPHYCDQCDFRCGRRSNLNIHRKKSHNLPTLSKQQYINLIDSGNHPFCTSYDFELLTLLN